MSAPSLCDACAHVRRLPPTRTGMVYLFCERAREDARYAKYPPQPTLRCPGHEPGPPPSRPDAPLR